MTDKVSVREVGLRDGLQLVGDHLATDIKIEWCRRQAGAGFREIEVTSFVPASVIPQFADAADVLTAAKTVEGLTPSVLVPNLKGGIRALDHAAPKITFVLSASEAHNQSNVRKSTDASLGELRALVAAANIHETNAEIACVIATSFGCSIQGPVEPRRVMEVAEQALGIGVDELNIADTVGYAHPAEVARLFRDLNRVAGEFPVAAHFHDTRAMGLANVHAAVDAGIRRFDASLGGLGGCPFAPGATGNIATEDCVYLLESLGLDTGIDIDAMIDVRRRLPDWLPGERIEGRLLQAGVAKTFRQ